MDGFSYLKRSVHVYLMCVTFCNVTNLPCYWRQHIDDLLLSLITPKLLSKGAAEEATLFSSELESWTPKAPFLDRRWQHPLSKPPQEPSKSPPLIQQYRKNSQVPPWAQFSSSCLFCVVLNLGVVNSTGCLSTNGGFGYRKGFIFGLLPIKYCKVFGRLPSKLLTLL